MCAAINLRVYAVEHVNSITYGYRGWLCALAIKCSWVDISSCQLLT